MHALAATNPVNLPLDEFLLIVRLALVALLYLVILQVVGVARRDLRQLAVAPSGTTRGRPVVGHLIVVDSGSTDLVPGSRINIEAVTTIGHSPTSTIELKSSFVSKDHARVLFRDHSLWVEDVGSKNGTKVNGRPVTTAVAVEPGNILEVGDVRFKFAV